MYLINSYKRLLGFVNEGNSKFRMEEQACMHAKDLISADFDYSTLASLLALLEMIKELS